jgi:hypothetical protein
LRRLALPKVPKQIAALKMKKRSFFSRLRTTVRSGPKRPDQPLRALAVATRQHTARVRHRKV